MWVAVPDTEAARAIQAIKRGISLPLIADIHFDYRLALMALDAGADGLRLNPGNINQPEKVATMVSPDWYTELSMLSVAPPPPADAVCEMPTTARVTKIAKTNFIELFILFYLPN